MVKFWQLLCNYLAIFFNVLVGSSTKILLGAGQRGVVYYFDFELERQMSARV